MTDNINLDTVDNENSTKIADDELNNVSGGGCHAPDGRLVVTALYSCDNWSCVHCGHNISYHMSGRLHAAPGCNAYCSVGKSASYNTCMDCGHCSKESGRLLCNHPSHRS